MTPELLTQADTILDSCGRPQMPKSSRWVDYAYGIPYNRFALGATPPAPGPVFNDEVLVDTPVPFLLRAIQVYVPQDINGAVNWRLRFPTGRYWNSNNSQGPFATGSFRYPFQQPIECAPHSKFEITLDGQTAQWRNAGGMSAIFEGCLRYPFRGKCDNQAWRPNQAELALPRYPQDQNQNIIAPEWRKGNQCYPETPAGYRDEPFTYCGYLSNTIPVPWTGDVVANQQLPFESYCDFVIRFFGFQLISETGTANGNLCVRIRDDMGYEMTDGFTPLGIGVYPLFPEWWIRSVTPQGATRLPGLYIDYQLVDGSGTLDGVQNIQPIFGGVKRRKVR